MERNLQSWKPELYDGKLGIISELGRGAVDWLAPTPGERILDLGCGTGDLAAVIAGYGADVKGLDSSASMIAAARTKFPGLRFEQADGQSFTETAPFDAVFSNAALHWMRDAEGAARSVWNALRPGGRFIAEFGGKGNVRMIIRAVQAARLAHHGRQSEGESGPWYFPSIGEYAALLEKQGFTVLKAIHFERPTPMQDGQAGLLHWLNSFGDPMLTGLSGQEREAVYEYVRSATIADLFRDGTWWIDYRRIRIEARKPQ
jgi:trans-aconitate methyltransferase